MVKNEFIGKWSIVEMEQWDKDFIDAEMPGLQFRPFQIMGLPAARQSNLLEIKWSVIVSLD
jgi:hypothetical protein